MKFENLESCQDRQPMTDSSPSTQGGLEALYNVHKSPKEKCWSFTIKK